MTAPPAAPPPRHLRQGGDTTGLTGITLDLSLCGNPLGPAPAVDAALKTFDCTRLMRPPYGAAEEYLAAFATDLGVDVQDLTAGSGVTGFINFTGRLLRKQARRGQVAIITPEYSGTLKAFPRADLISPPPGTHPGVKRRRDMVHQAMHTHPYVILSNPSNPEGIYIPAEELLDLARGHRHAMLIVDEEYHRFERDADARSLAGTELRNVAVWQSTGKTYGIPGTRAGILWTRNRRMAKRARRDALTWPLSLLDAVVCTAALADTSWRDGSLGQIRTESYLLGELLGQLFGASRVHGSAHFRFVELANPEPVAKHLERQGIAVRTFLDSVPGHPSGIRILTPIGTAARDRLADAVNSCPRSALPR
ncbi:aminotransferase class I/II-fold pyridoxal phosphate-dependent enzyme [Streptomyces niveus]|uniref:aminotransferase class I/II-fold pyridoxal phosphate-dependent enzyme n=1 Tax=Streptomyces niveus TaxID=193462 RepID=UPI00369142BF